MLKFVRRKSQKYLAAVQPEIINFDTGMDDVCAMLKKACAHLAAMTVFFELAMADVILSIGTIRAAS
jgi:hypothetical protein